MNALRILIVSFCLLTMSAFAASKRQTSITKGKQTYLKNLQKKCEDGLAIACYDYGVALSRSKVAKDRRKGSVYVRRACTLAYAPACKQKFSTVRAETVVTATPQTCDLNKAAATISIGGNLVSSVTKGSFWERAGVMQGDSVVSINDAPFSGYDQVADSLSTGSMVLNVMRNGKPTSLMVSCP